MKKQYIKWGIIAVVSIVALFLVYPVIASYFAFQQVNVSPEIASSKLVTCTVTINNPVGVPLIRNGDLNFASNPACDQTYVSFCGRFGVFSDSGQLKINGEGGIGNAVNVNVYEGSSDTYTLKWCGSKSTRQLSIDLYNDNGGLLYKKQVSLS